MIDRIEFVKRRLKKVVRLAEKIYGVQMYDKLRVKIKKKNGIIGWADYGPDEEYPFYIGLNIDCILGTKIEFDYICNDTIPHEVAHLICDVLYPNYASHCKEWKNICTSLGGNGNVRGPSYMNYYNNGTYRYTSNNGNQYNLSKISHNRVQNLGTAYIYKGDNRIDNTCQFEVL